MNNILFEGIYSAIYSIYDEDMNVIKESVEKLVKFGEKNGLRGFYVGGNTGECTVLPNKTRMQMLECVKACAAPESKIIAHIGAGHFDDTLELIEHANLVGVDAIASLPPSLTSYYNANEIVEYYRYIAKLSKAPVLAYVTPVLTCDLVWFANEIMSIPNVVGLKVSIANYYAFEKLKTVNGGNINILNGPDECMISGLAMGADGAIGTSYNIMPATACAIYDNFMKGDIATARQHQHMLNSYIGTYLGTGIVGWKSALKFIGIDPGYTVFPAHTVTDEDMAKFEKALTESGALAKIREMI